MVVYVYPSEKKLVITDNHMHINHVKGLGPAKVARRFKRYGGTCLFIVTLPSWKYGVKVVSGKDYEKLFSLVARYVREVEGEGVKAYAVVGPHPAELTQLVKRGFSLEEAAEIVREGIDIAAKKVDEGEAVAIGEVGRPHYRVPGDVWEVSNKLMFYAMEKAKELGCAVQLHTERYTDRNLAEIAEMAKKAGIATFKVVRHFSPPVTPKAHKYGITLSIVASLGNIKTAFKRVGGEFMFETDYLDDLTRPNAVLPPETIPKNLVILLKKGVLTVEQVEKACLDVPERVYGVNVY